MSIFDRLKNHLENSATATLAISATDAMGTVAEIAVATLPKENPESQSLTPLPIVIASDGRVLAWSTDPPHIRVYAWALQILRFAPVDESTAKSPLERWTVPGSGNWPLISG